MVNRYVVDTSRCRIFDADLSKGPGHYMNTSFPGLGSTVAIAGHRTTYGAWFRHIDETRSWRG